MRFWDKSEYGEDTEIQLRLAYPEAPKAKFLWASSSMWWKFWKCNLVLTSSSLQSINIPNKGYDFEENQWKTKAKKGNRAPNTAATFKKLIAGSVNTCT